MKKRNLGPRDYHATEAATRNGGVHQCLVVEAETSGIEVIKTFEVMAGDCCYWHFVMIQDIEGSRLLGIIALALNLEEPIPDRKVWVLMERQP